MDVSVVVTSYKNPQLLRLCLDSILSCSDDISCEIIVVDSETEENTEMMMREDFPTIKFFPFKKNVGFQALLKKGIKNSSGEFLLLLNGDILVKPDSIQRLLTQIKKDISIGIIAPKLLNFNGTLQYSCFRFYSPITIIYRRTFFGKFNFAQKHLDWFLMKDLDHSQSNDVDWVMGSALMVSKKALAKVGLMDPRFFMYMEDVDWCRRFWENGFRVVYFPNAEMFHYHGKGSDKGGILQSLLFNRLTWSHIRSALVYFKKYLGKESPREIYKKDLKN
jgi:GT2 family glycosyltransferase